MRITVVKKGVAKLSETLPYCPWIVAVPPMGKQ